MASQNLKIAVSDGISETLIREMTAEEIANLQKAQDDIAAEYAAQKAQAEAIAQAKAQAEAKLAKLGLTADDLRALGL